MKIYQKRIDDIHLDSYFYNGLIAQKGKYQLIANGEIQLLEDKEPENDEEVANCYNNSEFIQNNWFEIIDIEDDNYDDVIDANYDEAIEILKNYNN